MNALLRVPAPKKDFLTVTEATCNVLQKFQNIASLQPNTGTSIRSEKGANPKNPLLITTKGCSLIRTSLFFSSNARKHLSSPWITQAPIPCPEPQQNNLCPFPVPATHPDIPQQGHR